MAAPKLLQWLGGVLRDPGSSHLSALSFPAVGFRPQTHRPQQLLPAPCVVWLPDTDQNRKEGAGAKTLTSPNSVLLMKLTPRFPLTLHWLRVESCAHPGPITVEWGMGLLKMDYDLSPGAVKQPIFQRSRDFCPLAKPQIKISGEGKMWKWNANTCGVAKTGPDCRSL